MRSLQRPGSLSRFAAITASAGLLLTGCGTDAEGDGDVDALDGIEVSLDGESPEVTIDGEISAEEISSRVLEEGDGDDVQGDDIVTLDIVAVDPESGDVNADNLSEDSGQQMPLTKSLKSQSPELYEVLSEQKVGATMAYYVPEGAFNAGSEASLNILRITDTAPPRATGEEVDEADIDSSLPEVTRDEDTGEPTIATPEGDAPTELVIQPLIEGDGEEVQASADVMVHYSGVKWSDGESFDSSWSRGEPTSFNLDQVVEGWGEGLEGQKVGSQVMLVVPPDKGYGNTPGHELEKETLVFVVDILSTN